MQRKIKIGATYMHYKQHPVHVIGIALHSETLKEMVIYEKMKDAGEYKKGSIWVRPKKMFWKMC